MTDEQIVNLVNLQMILKNYTMDRPLKPWEALGLYHLIEVLLREGDQMNHKILLLEKVMENKNVGSK